MKIDKRHVEWLNLVQQDGLLVSALTLTEKEIYQRQDIVEQQLFREVAEESGFGSLEDFQRVVKWPHAALREPTESEKLHFPDLFATIAPTKILRSRDNSPLLAVFWCDEGLDASPKDAKWVATHQVRVDRYLNQRAPHIGVHLNANTIRLCYAPPGESPATLDFPVDFMCMSDGRILIDALHMLLGGRQRMYTDFEDKTLEAIIKDSRANQEQVTETLAGQVEEALRILIAGFDRANARSGKKLLRDVDTTELYDALTSVLLRMVFTLYAEDKGLLPTDNAMYNNAYSISGLGQQLEQDYVFHSASMDRRYGAWGRLCTLFRLIFFGSSHPDMRMPPRQGDLFDPGRDGHGFLEGRLAGAFSEDLKVDLPEIDDLCVHEILQKLRYLKGQMLSYRNLEVEQIGSVYEALMGLQIDRADGPSVALTKDLVVVSLHDLREAKSPVKMLVTALGKKKDADIVKLFPGTEVKEGEEGTAIPSIKDWQPIEDIDADLESLKQVLASQTRGEVIQSGEHYLQGSPGRRWSGSHYTPRSLSEPIVRKTIDPVLGDNPTPEDILNLKVCDPAMGSAAFLAEACRYLGEKLVEAWTRTNSYPNRFGKQEDWSLVARRMIAERCLYGVDKNPRAVQLARLSMWIVTSAKDLPFTFLDHNLKYGDAVVGCNKRQIATFDWQGVQKKQMSLPLVNRSTKESVKHRATITADQLELRFNDPKQAYKERKGRLSDAEEAVQRERTIGDLLVACVWAGGSKGEVKKRLERMQAEMEHYHVNLDVHLSSEAKELLYGLYNGAFGFRPFHWELEFPEVFERENGGFDAIVGNPPFMGQDTIRKSNGGPVYIKLLQTQWTHADGKTDMCAYFFLKSVDILAKQRCFGLIATNTISQGVTRKSGLQFLCNTRNVELYCATVDLTWPVDGASVVVSVLHGSKGTWQISKYLDDNKVSWINSSLEPINELPDPVVLNVLTNKTFEGYKIYGQGFILTPEERLFLIEQRQTNISRIFRYIGGLEINNSAHLTSDKFVINFGEMAEAEARQYPDLFQIVQDRVKPYRDTVSRENHRLKWWRYGETRKGLTEFLQTTDKVLVCSKVSKHWMLAFQPSNRIWSHSVQIFAYTEYCHFAVLQSKVHEFWARRYSGTLELRLSYSPSSCFQTFPFPPSTPETDQRMEDTGKALYEARSAYMIKHQVGMTETWNRLLEENNEHYYDEEIEDIRQKRYDMDRAVLDAYGWTDLEPTDDKDIIARLRKLNAERALEEVLGEGPSMDALVQSATKHIKALGTMQGDFAMTSDTTVNDLVTEAEKKLKKVKSEVTKAKKLIRPYKTPSTMLDADAKKKVHKAAVNVRKLVDEILSMSVESDDDGGEG